MIQGEETDESPQRSAFPATPWTLVLQVNGDDGDRARDALQDLCGRYWFPVYSFARRQGLNPEDAEDATQAFFARLISSDSIQRADRDKGRLRSFLMGGMKNFLAQRWRDANTLKRGREISIVPIEGSWAEERLEAEAVGALEKVEDDLSFDRSWAIALIDRATRRLESYYVKRDRIRVFESLKPCLIGDGSYETNPELMDGLGLGPEGLRSAVHQMRRRFRRYVEEEVAETVEDQADIRDELVLLCRVLAGR